MNDGNFIHVAAWMVNKLGLKGNELLIFAIIFGFSQAQGQKFVGSAQYLADWLKCTRQGISKNLQSLIEKGYIVKGEIEQNGERKIYYQTCVDVNKVDIDVSTKFTEDVNKVDNGRKQSLHAPLNNNINNNINNNNRRFTPPALDEVKAYCEERNNNIDPSAFVDYYTANGWKVGGRSQMKDWRAAVRQWERNDIQAGRKKTPKPMDNKSYDLEEVEKFW